MQYQPEYAFILPLDDDDDGPEDIKYVSDTEIPLTGVDTEIPKSKKRKQKTKVDDEPIETVEATFRQNFMKLVWYVIRWYVLIYLVILGVIYPLFHFVLDNDQKQIILQAVAFCDDWKQLIFFFGLYVSFAVKKVSDISSVSLLNYISPNNQLKMLLSKSLRIYQPQIKLQTCCRYAQKVM